MFEYHSNLKTTSPHPFASEWYTWPFNYRPVFFYQGQGYPPHLMSSMSQWAIRLFGGAPFAQ